MTATAPAPAAAASPSNKYVTLMPEMTPEEFARLKADIKHKGVLEPLLFDQNDVLIDGRNRMRAFMELINEGADLPMFDKIVRHFETDDARIEHVLSHNLVRRHLNAEQRADLAIKLRLPPYSYTVAKIGEMLSVSVGTVHSDLSMMTPEEKVEMRQASIVASDGRVFRPEYAPRVFTTGNEQLRQMQVSIVKESSAHIAQMSPSTDGPSTPRLEGEAPAENGPPNAITVSGPDLGGPVVYLPSHQVAPVTVVDARKRYSAFAWYGGKGSHLSWLLPILPPSMHFVDVFGGSAAVIMNRNPSDIETYNDIDGELVNFFQVVRDKPDDLMRLLTLTPFAREERRKAFMRRKESMADLSDLERARLFFVLARQTRSGMAQNTLDSVLNSWKWTRDSIQRGMSSSVSQWQTGIDGLAAVAARFRSIQIENYPALDVIKLYDTPGTLFYCDPPYVHDTRAKGNDQVYSLEMTDADHSALAGVLHGIKGRAAVSGYPSELYNELYKDWYHFDMPALSKDSIGQAAERVERLWTNYPITEAHQMVAKESALLEPDDDSDEAFGPVPSR